VPKITKVSSGARSRTARSDARSSAEPARRSSVGGGASALLGAGIRAFARARGGVTGAGRQLVDGWRELVDEVREERAAKDSRPQGRDGVERVSLSEAARRLGVSPKTVRRRLDRGELRGRRERTGHGETWVIELPRDAEATPREESRPAPSAPARGSTAKRARTARSRRRATPPKSEAPRSEAASRENGPTEERAEADRAGAAAAEAQSKEEGS
jgi:hypothetical protein